MKIIFEKKFDSSIIYIILYIYNSKKYFTLFKFYQHFGFLLISFKNNQYINNECIVLEKVYLNIQISNNFCTVG